MNYNEKSIDSIMEYAHGLIGKSFGEIDVKNERLGENKGKGNLGQIIEESYFGYEINSRAEADFSHVGVELKVTPFKVNKNKTISAKERLVLNIINYMEEYQKDFYESSFWSKNNKLLLVFYQWKKELDKKDYIVKDIMLHEFSEEDLVVIRDDWSTIINKIKEGKAHELSEGDTNYLAACPKGANKSSVRKQPFSDELAMQRAFSLKSSYMTSLIRKRLGIEDDKVVSILKGTKMTIEQLLESRFKVFYGKSVDEISEDLGIDLYNGKSKLAKNYVQMLISRILGLTTNDLSKIDEFAKANIKFKTIRIEKNGKIKEHMSFPTFKYKEIIEEEWHNSSLRNLFEEQKYLFVVFRYDENDVLRLDKIKLWNMPVSILDGEVKYTWEETIRVIKAGVKIEYKGSRAFDNLPGPTFNGVCHTRPHATDSSDTYDLPDGRKLTKKCFWLDREFILKAIEDKI
ncbi:Sau3AI family type II restriction endonuclease [Terrisporobacter vanillatitrophus]|uniref:Sau3AI family type II restriction endonuclease n=1 Tax=Terrisporobacter vanillatitrophus TaxID=3058402 RepID=UPI003365C770